MKRQGQTNQIAKNIKRKWAQINKEQRQEYFINIENEVKDVPPCNIWNYGETNLRGWPWI